MSTWLKNNILNCKWTLQIWFGKDSTRFNETLCLQYASVSHQRSFGKITSKARSTPLMQIPWGGINLIERNIFLFFKKMSKHVGNVTEVSSVMRTSVRNTLWKRMYLGVRRRTNKPRRTGPTAYFYPEMTPLMSVFLSGQVNGGFWAKVKITSSNIFELDVYHTQASLHSKTFLERFRAINSTLVQQK